MSVFIFSDKSVCVYEWKVSLGYVEVPYSPLLGHKYGVTCVRFSPQGTMLASASIDGSTVLWNVQVSSLYLYVIFYDCF